MGGKLKSLLAITVVAALVIGFTLGNLVNTTIAQTGEPESIPSVINYQGTLFNPDTGYPVADGDYTFVFSIYEAETDGDPLWQETQVVSVSGGLFSVLLGSVNPLPADLFSDRERYLGVQVGDNEEMSPRQQLSSVPYAFQAESAKTYEETDPTVDENVKDGVDWTELSGIPTGFADDVDNDTQLSEAVVDAMVSNNGYLTGENDPVFIASAASGINSGDITNWNTAYDWGDQTTQLGSWQSKNTDTVYQAPTDGFVLADVWGPPGATLLLEGYTDGSNPPTTVRTRAHGSSPMAVSITMPVRKGDYWKLQSGGWNDQVWWIGLGN